VPGAAADQAAPFLDLRLAVGSAGIRFSVTKN
jgi:hypothetical protein